MIWRIRMGLAGLIARVRGAFAPALHVRWMWLEIVVITGCALTLGLIFQRDDPLQIRTGFPWVWLAPVLIALRYGVAPGIFSSLMLLGTWQVLRHFSETGHGFPQQYFLGGLILVILSGEFATAWGARLRNAEETSRYLTERFGRLTLQHLLLKASHERMEQEALAKPITLRDALLELRALTAAQHDEQLPASHSLLQLLSQHCQLESAAIFVSAHRGYVRTCEIGTPSDLRPDDPLLLHAQKHQSLAHLLTDGLTEAASPSPFLVVAPIQSSGQYVLGILAVDRIPFVALNEENLQMLSVLLGYYADCVVESDETGELFGQFPDAPADFAEEFSRMLRLRRDHQVDSHIVVHSFANDESGRHALIQHELIRRSLDVSWQMEADGRIVLANLMPLADKTAVREYLLRSESRLQEYVGSTYDERSLTPIVISLAERDPIASLMRVIKGIPA